MNKFLLLCIFFIVSTGIVFAEKTQWFAVGYERSGYSFSSAALSPGAVGYGSNGLNLQGYTFKDEKRNGWFSATTLRFPNVITATDGIYTETYGIREIYDSAFAVDMKFGLGFRSNPEKVVQLYGGLGPHILVSFFSLSFYDYDYGSIASNEIDIALGIGLELGAKFNFSETVSLLLGSGLALDLAGYYRLSATNGYQTETDSDWVQGYLGFDISPKLCLNFQW
ncbi:MULTISPECIES: hypothetical protein [unclassified Oceanispirochaeta]|uniref:hypothetical protein n=1 Tax=unclassified Oceanispirochaeta TaxID=2635722 RepID=UPI000E08FF86|nr:MULTISPECIES: hypothetical protein [unclassified Oceanispirochaeta]MBF9018893.1 hypothetical protein [Oceanispirochaeta sp. M2]NPD75392.1 hypothetical protein [Oceanispirochaeta sp. M1]RDG28755.1 hypothetical protein DV872_25185 [Oceanispirochaeta sp. M1]